MNDQLTPEHQRIFKEVTEMVQKRQDVITVAKLCRAGIIAVDITPLVNGWVVSLRSTDEKNPLYMNFVYNRPEYVGRLMQSLFNANLEFEAVLKRLRSLMGL